uniref:Uncharacterized protein n=1 Tax=Octopus bimaculoides TaxID=37653 RepID=A0A0L8FV47_OCTBM
MSNHMKRNVSNLSLIDDLSRLTLLDLWIVKSISASTIHSLIQEIHCLYS